MYKPGEYQQYVDDGARVYTEPIPYGIIDNAVYIPSCECGGGLHYENFLLNSRDVIARYFSSMKRKAETLVEEFGDAADAAKK